MEIIKINLNEKIIVNEACKQLFQLGIDSEEIGYLIELEYQKNEDLLTLKDWVKIELEKQLEILALLIDKSRYEIEHNKNLDMLCDIVRHSNFINHLNNILVRLNCEDMW